MTLGKPVNEIVQESTNPLLGQHNSWKRAELKLVAEVLNGYAFESSSFSKSKGVPLIRIRDVGKNNTECLYEGKFEPIYIVKKGDLLVGMDGDFNSAVWEGDEGLLNQRVCKISVNQQFYDSKFLELVLPAYLKEINNHTSSVTVKHLSSKSIGEIPLPLPPLSEQHRIVSKVEALFSFLDAGVASLKTVQAQLKRYRRAVLKAAFEGKLTHEWRVHNEKVDSTASLLERIRVERNKLGLPQWSCSNTINIEDLPIIPKSWIWVRFGELGLFINGDRSKENYPNKSEYVGNGIPWINTGHIKPDGTLSVKRMNYISREKFQSLRSGQIKEGDLVYCLRGATFGKTAFVTPFKEGAIASSLMIIRLTQLLNKEYIFLYLKSDLAKHELSKYDNGSAQPNLAAKSVRLYCVPLPPREEQNAIVSGVNQHFIVLENTLTNLTKSITHAENFRNGILSAAFRGKLVPQDQNEETAEQLLQHIKAEKLSNKSRNDNQVELSQYVK